jgi:hypothetical protein
MSSSIKKDRGMNLLVHLTGSAVEEENTKQKGWIRAPTC